jgi:DNA-binding FadR family transcriptional regulator
MPQADRVSEVVRYLENRILSGKLVPGDLLPSEREISADMDVSRSVVREAIGRLASLGLVRSVQGSGTRVEPPSGRPIAAGYRRLPLETAIASLAARHRSEDHLARLAQAQAELANPNGSLEAHVRADLDFHAILAEASGNPLFGLVLSPIQELLIESRRRTLGQHGAQLAHTHHAAILTAVHAQDAAAAARAMQAHLEANFQHLSSPQEL